MMDALNLIDKLREEALFQISDIPAAATTKEQEHYMRGVAEGLRQAAEHIAELMDIPCEEGQMPDAPHLLQVACSRCDKTNKILENPSTLKSIGLFKGGSL